jgi:hypothetical protein
MNSKNKTTINTIRPKPTHTEFVKSRSVPPEIFKEIL